VAFWFRSPEDRLFLAIRQNDLPRVRHALAGKPRLDATTMWPADRADGRRLTPVELAAEIASVSRDSDSAIGEALIEYGFPRLHHCEPRFTDPTNPCAFACPCGRTGVQHDFVPVHACGRSEKVCSRCGASSDTWMSTRVYGGGRASGPHVRICLACGVVVGHSALDGMRPDWRRSLRYVGEASCEMEDPESGRRYPDIHIAVIEIEEYDSDYGRTAYHLDCLRCGRRVGLRAPGTGYDGRPTSSEEDKSISRRAHEREAKAFEDELRTLVKAGRAVDAMKRYREREPRATQEEAKRFVRGLG
jgi:hypothetical protein